MACSRFPASVPVAGDDLPLGSTALVPGGPGRPVRVLVADDDARVRAAIAQTIALEADLALVADAADAPAALALAESTDPAVALVDVLLPDAAAGLALVAALGRRPGCAVVAMSVRSGLRQAAWLRVPSPLPAKRAASTPSWTRSGPRHRPITSDTAVRAIAQPGCGTVGDGDCPGPFLILALHPGR